VSENEARRKSSWLFVGLFDNRKVDPVNVCELGRVRSVADDVRADPRL